MSEPEIIRSYKHSRDIDGEMVRKLASVGLIVSEIAAVMECSKDTLERNFMDVINEGREKRNGSLRRKQFEMAMAGNATMLIWLGKQYLKQGERFQTEQTDRLDEVLEAFKAGPVLRGEVNAPVDEVIPDEQT